MKKIFSVLVLIFFMAGCGYTTHSLISPEFKTIYVENFKNTVNISTEQTDTSMYVGYRPGMEVDITRAVIDKFLLDGNLKITDSEKADLILKGELAGFKKEALRYDANDNVEEYRTKILVNIELVDAKNQKTVWKERDFAGEATYRTGGSLAASETSSVKQATSDLARRVVERTVEGW